MAYIPAFGKGEEEEYWKAELEVNLNINASFGYIMGHCASGIFMLLHSFVS